MKSRFTSRTRWREKLEKPQDPKLVTVPPKMSRFGKGTMLIPTPRLVDDLIRKVPKGKLATVSELRRRLAADFTADVTCPLTRAFSCALLLKPPKKIAAMVESVSRHIGAW